MLRLQEALIPTVPEILEYSTALDLFEAAPCGYLFMQPDGTITKANQTFLSLTGYSAVDLVGLKRFQDLLTGPAKIFYETHFSPLLHMQGFVKEITVDLRCASGDTLPTLVNSNVITDSAGNKQICTAVFDIRERRRYERELLSERRKAEHLAQVVENAGDAVLSVTNDLIVDSWNHGAESLFGYRAQEVIGRHVRDLIVPAEFVSEFEKAVAALKAGRPLTYETRRANKNGELIDVSVMIAPNISPPDELIGYAVIIRDIRARKKAEALEHSRRDLALINHLAHEINNPLQSLVSCLYILERGHDPELVTLAEQQAKRVAQVVLDLLKLTRTLDTATKKSEDPT
jgi:PAS domain S-box-containing protein